MPNAVAFDNFKWGANMYRPMCSETWVDVSDVLFPEVVHIFCNNYKIERQDVKNVLVTSFEPERLRASNLSVIADASRFDLILANHPSILNALPSKSRFLACGGCFVDPLECVDRGNVTKPFGVSFICGAKSFAPGHSMRHELWERQHEIHIQKEFWISAAQPVKAVDSTNKIMDMSPRSKINTLSNQYHICIENYFEPSFFTEKLIDCFVTDTIPIYVGHSTISHFFDVRGMIICNNVDEIICKANAITAGHYFSVEQSRRINREFALRHTRPYGRRIAETIGNALFSGRWR